MNKKCANLLVINTAFKESNLAIATAGGDFFSKLPSSAKHSENVLKSIDSLLSKAKIDVSELDVVAVVTGPGSFTGLRIGTAIAKGFGCANENLHFLSLSSLALLAYIAVKTNNMNSDFVVALDALSNLVFMQKFSRDGKPLESERLTSADELKGCNLPIYSLDLPNCKALEITSEALLEFAKGALTREKFAKLEDMVPKYLRLSQAEANLKGTNAGE